MDTNPKGKQVVTEVGTLSLCGVQGCCPTVDFTNPQEVVFRDDHGGVVRLTSEEWNELKKFIRKSKQG